MAHRIAPRTETNLYNIWLYVAKESGNIEIANSLIDTITERFVVLGSFPRIGRSRTEDLGPGYRSLAVGEVCHRLLMSKRRTRSSCALYTAAATWKRFSAIDPWLINDKLIIRQHIMQNEDGAVNSVRAV
jgi:plasmid stabilization system protein ParE